MSDTADKLTAKWVTSNLSIDEYSTTRNHCIIVDLEPEARKSTKAYVSGSTVSKMVKAGASFAAVRLFMHLYEIESTRRIPSRKELATALELSEKTISSCTSLLTQLGYMYQISHRTGNHSSKMLFLGVTKVQEIRYKLALKELVRYNSEDQLKTMAHKKPEDFKALLATTEAWSIYK